MAETSNVAMALGTRPGQTRGGSERDQRELGQGRVKVGSPREVPGEFPGEVPGEAGQLQLVCYTGALYYN